MPYLSPLIEPLKTTNKMKYVNGELGFLKHPEWKHEVLGQIKGQNVVKIAKSNPMQDTVHFHVVDPKTNEIHMQVQGQLSPSTPHSYRIGWLEGRQSPVKAHELYDFLLRKGHVSQLETQEQSPGGARVWQKLAKRRNINVYGLKDNGYNADAGREYTPVNIDLSNRDDYYDSKLETNYSNDSDTFYHNRYSSENEEEIHRKMSNDSTREADHELSKKYTKLYASYHPHVLREAVQAIREMMTLNKLPVVSDPQTGFKASPYLSTTVHTHYGTYVKEGGAFSVGFPRNKPNRPDSFIKVYRDNQYDDFLDHVKANRDNPHLPKIYAHKVIQKGNNQPGVTNRTLGVVRMEHLQPLPSDHPIYDALRNRVPTNNPSQIHDFFKGLGYVKLANTVKDLHTKFPRKIWDLHKENIMMRPNGKTPVIIDPWFGK